MVRKWARTQRCRWARELRGLPLDHRGIGKVEGQGAVGRQPRAAVCVVGGRAAVAAVQYALPPALPCVVAHGGVTVLLERGVAAAGDVLGGARRRAGSEERAEQPLVGTPDEVQLPKPARSGRIYGGPQLLSEPAAVERPERVNAFGAVCPGAETGGQQRQQGGQQHIGSGQPRRPRLLHSGSFEPGARGSFGFGAPEGAAVSFLEPIRCMQIEK